MKIKHLLIFLTILALVFTAISYASDNCDKYSKTSDEYTKCLEDLLDKAGQKIANDTNKLTTLTNQKVYLTDQIYLAELRIQRSEAKIRDTEVQIVKTASDITDLGARIDKLVNSIDYQKKVLDSRMRERYKSTDESVVLFFGSDDLSKMIKKIEYLVVMEKFDNKLMSEMRETKQNFDTQKRLFEDKKAEEVKFKTNLVSEKVILIANNADLQDKKAELEKLIKDTQDDESKWQEILAQARADLEATDAVLGGKGIEGIGAAVKTGQKIATVISGRSCNSGGTHLHFAVRKNGSSQNPFNYLKKISDFLNCSGSSCSSRGGDPFNPSGSWKWPLVGNITLTQGYGYTWAIKNTWVGNLYSFHDGVDLQPSAPSVYAVADGTFYKGSYNGSGGCQLRYVRLDHKNGMQSYYLHVNY